MLAVPSRAGARLPHTIFEIDAEVRAVLSEIETMLSIR
jgi:hypothetical protein